MITFTDAKEEDNNCKFSAKSGTLPFKIILKIFFVVVVVFSTFPFRLNGKRPTSIFYLIQSNSLNFHLQRVSYICSSIFTHSNGRKTYFHLWAAKWELSYSECMEYEIKAARDFSIWWMKEMLLKYFKGKICNEVMIKHNIGLAVATASYGARTIFYECNKCARRLFSRNTPWKHTRIRADEGQQQKKYRTRRYLLIYKSAAAAVAFD